MYSLSTGFGANDGRADFFILLSPFSAQCVLHFPSVVGDEAGMNHNGEIVQSGKTENSFRHFDRWEQRS